MLELGEKTNELPADGSRRTEVRHQVQLNISREPSGNIARARSPALGANLRRASRAPRTASRPASVHIVARPIGAAAQTTGAQLRM